MFHEEARELLTHVIDEIKSIAITEEADGLIGAAAPIYNLAIKDAIEAVQEIMDSDYNGVVRSGEGPTKK